MYDIDDFFLTNQYELRWLMDLYYYISGIFFIVVILNLLLSILFDTYDQVISQQMKSSTYERLIMIYNIEKKMSQREIQQLKDKNIMGRFLCLN